MKTIASSLFALTLTLSACGDGHEAAPDPIAERIETLFPSDPSYGAFDRGQIRRMMETAPSEDGPFYMINLIRHREEAIYSDGRETDLSGAEADAIYGSLVLPILIEMGAELIFVADVELNLIDLDGAGWTQVAIVLYPSRAKFLEMVEREDLRAAAVHKEAGVEKTVVLVSQIDGDPIPEELRTVDLETLPFPPTEQDQPIAIAHLLDYNEIAQYADGRETTLTGREAMALYEQGRQDQGVLELGVRPGLWLTIEGEFVGDGRGWEEFRINNFPSRSAFAQLTNPQSAVEAGIEHRVAALNETYTQVTAPVLTQVGYQ